MLQVEGAVADVLRGALLLGVVAGAQLLRLDLSGSLLTLLALVSTPTQGGQRMLLLLGDPAVGSNVGCLANCGAVEDVVVGVARLGRAGHPGVAVRGQVLIELVDVEAADVGDDVTAQLTDVHGAKVYIELAAGALLNRAALSLQVSLAGRKICLGGRWGCWWPL